MQSCRQEGAGKKVVNGMQAGRESQAGRERRGSRQV